MTTSPPRMVTHIRGDVHVTPPITDLMGVQWQPQRYRYCSVIDQTEVTWKVGSDGR